MKSLLQEYQHVTEGKRIDINKKTEHTADFSRSRSRNSCIRSEVLSDLKENRPSRLTMKSLDFRSPPPLERVTTGDSRPASLSPVSPTSLKRRSVLLGFRLNSITLVLKQALVNMNELGTRYFLKRLQRDNNVSKSLAKLINLLSLKQLNQKFHSFSNLMQYAHSIAFPISKDFPLPTIVHVPCLLPLGSIHPLSKLPPYLHYHGSGDRINRYAAIGKVVGVIMGVSRFYKITFINILKRKKFRKLKYLIDA